MRNYSIRRVDYDGMNTEHGFNTSIPNTEDRSYLTMVDGAGDSVIGLETVKSKARSSKKRSKSRKSKNKSRKSKITRVTNASQNRTHNKTLKSPSFGTARHTMKSALTRKT